MFNLNQEIDKVKKLLDLKTSSKTFCAALEKFQKLNQKKFDVDIKDFLYQLKILERNLQFECDDLKSFLESFISLHGGNFQSSEKDQIKNDIKKIERKLINFTELNNKALEIKSYLSIPDMNNFYNNDDKLLIQKYRSLNVAIQNNEIQLDMLINEKESTKKEINELNLKENSYSTITETCNSLEFSQNETKKNIEKSIKELKDANIAIKFQEGKIQLEKNQDSDLQVKTYLFTDSDEDFFVKKTSNFNISVFKMDTKKPTFAKLKLLIKSSIEKTSYLNANNIFVVILKPFENIDFDFEWLDKKFEDSPRRINMTILSEITSLNNIKLCRNLKNVKSKMISIRDKEKALNEILKESKNLNQKLIDNNEIDFEIERKKECIKKLELRKNEIEAREKEENENSKNRIRDFKEHNENEKKIIIKEKTHLMNQNEALEKKISRLSEENDNMNSEKEKIRSKVEKLNSYYENKLESYNQANIEFYLFNEELILFEKYLNILTERNITLKKIFSFLRESFEKFDNFSDIIAYFEGEKFNLSEFSDFLNIALVVTE
jgi:hypothetical protein